MALTFKKGQVNAFKKAMSLSRDMYAPAGGASNAMRGGIDPSGGTPDFGAIGQATRRWSGGIGSTTSGQNLGSPALNVSGAPAPFGLPRDPLSKLDPVNYNPSVSPRFRDPKTTSIMSDVAGQPTPVGPPGRSAPFSSIRDAPRNTGPARTQEGAYMGHNPEYTNKAAGLMMPNPSGPSQAAIRGANPPMNPTTPSGAAIGAAGMGMAAMIGGGAVVGGGTSYMTGGSATQGAIAGGLGGAAMGMGGASLAPLMRGAAWQGAKHGAPSAFTSNLTKLTYGMENSANRAAMFAGGGMLGGFAFGGN
jgi:hypothetical protein